MDELSEQFAIEARELVQQAAADLLVLEHQPDDRGHLESAFRAIHTLKGSVGLFDLKPMLVVLHVAEDRLSAVRSGGLEIDAGLIDPLVAVIDWVDRCAEAFGDAGALTPALEHEAGALLTLLGGELPGQPDAVPAIGEDVVPAWALALQAEAGGSLASGLVALRYEPHPECFFNGDDPLALIASVPGIQHLKITPRQPWSAADAYDPFRCNLVIEALTDAPIGPVEALFRLIPDQVRLVAMATKPPPGAEPEVPSRGQRERQRSTMRVDTSRIDALIGIAGELITAKNGLLPLAASAATVSGDDRLSRRILENYRDIDRLTSALYAAVTQARMISLDQTFRRFPRLVRETAARLSKSVDFIVAGETLEADREIVENLFEPLLHLVRNALDHGIESAADRVAAGKPPRGRLALQARKRGEQIEVTVRDDGRGLDPDRIRHVAVAKRLVAVNEAASLDDADALQLIFRAGFSTAHEISDLSGRGVGLDAVKAAVQRFGGRVDVVNNVDAGATFRLCLPVSFTMSHLMIVNVGGERYGIPIEKVAEALKISRADVLPVRAGHAFVLRGATIPLLSLPTLLDLATPAETTRDVCVVVVAVGADRIGLIVDAIAERAETPMRPLSPLLRGVIGIAGTTVTGDGHVLLVLDLEELIA